MQGLLDLFRLYAWDHCLVETAIFSTVSWPMRLNSLLTYLHILPVHRSIHVYFDDVQSHSIACREAAPHRDAPTSIHHCRYGVLGITLLSPSRMLLFLRLQK